MSCGNLPIGVYAGVFPLVQLSLDDPQIVTIDLGLPTCFLPSPSTSSFFIRLDINFFVQIDFRLPRRFIDLQFRNGIVPLLSLFRV